MTSNPNSNTVDNLIELGESMSEADLRPAYFNVHGVRTKVLTNSDAFHNAVAKLLQPFLEPEKGDPDIVFYLFLVDSLDETMSHIPVSAEMLYDWDAIKIYYHGANRYLRVANRARVTADLEKGVAAGFASDDILQSDWLVTNLFFYPLWGQMLKVNGLFPIHAAGLAKAGKASLFLGRSGSGKSTLSLNMVRAGFGLLSDDTVFIRDRSGEVEVLSFPEEINIREETLELLPELSRVRKLNVNELRQKSSFHIEELYPNCIVDSAIPVIMVFPEISDIESTSFVPMAGTEALSESLRYGYFFLDPSTSERHFRLMSLLANQVDSYRLYSGSDQKQLEQQVSALLEKYCLKGK